MEREKGQTEMIRDDKDMEDIYENAPCPDCDAGIMGLNETKTVYKCDKCNCCRTVRKVKRR
mgnify:FL=1